MAKRQLTVHLEPDTVDQLQERGAAGAHGPGYVLRRRLSILESVIIHCDPRITRGFPDTYFDFVVSYLADPCSIPPDRIAALEAHIAQRLGFQQAARRAGIDPAKLRAAIGELTFAEKLALVDAAEVHQAVLAEERPPAEPSEAPAPSEPAAPHASWARPAKRRRA
jgi:hypothetical protein